ncbi:MAG: class I SAM-dependent methyltransferase [Nitrososphaerota archaeon]|nr:class I SAM-dependent methyltransferase [Nitrososphaerota archaeon]
MNNIDRDPFSAALVRNFGHPIFHILLLNKQVMTKFGIDSQRSVEYPWAITRLNEIMKACKGKAKLKALDIGVAESLFHYELLHKGMQVFGIDIRSTNVLSPKLLFYQRQLQNTGFPDSRFDLIFCISTLEHIGLSVYGQDEEDLEADIKCAAEMHRILNPHGSIIFTAPFEGKKGFHILESRFERHYDIERLEKIFPAKIFEWKMEAYYYLERSNRSLKYRHYVRESLPDAVASSKGDEPNLACLLLGKK